MAIVLARAPFRGQRIVRALVLLPLVLPPVVGGLALLYLFGRRGLLGPTFDFLGITIAFTTTAVILAQTFVALPFLVLSLEGALRSAGTRYEAVAATLGARPSTVLWRVTLPLVLPALVSGAVLSFARALGEFGATLTFAGSLQGVTRTLPLEIYLQRETDPDAAVALSLVLVVVAVIVVAVAHGAAEPARDPAEGCAVSLAFRCHGCGERGFDIALEVADGETLAVLGPNGAGKSTLLGLLAGLVRPDAGRATLGERTLFDFAEARQTWLAPHRRGVALLAQEPLLFPHLSVRANVAFGPRSVGHPGPTRAARAEHWLAETDTARARRPSSPASCPEARHSASPSRVHSRPNRGCCCSTNLSPRSTSRSRPPSGGCSRRVIADRTTIVVTHDALDAYLLADRVVVVGTRSHRRGGTHPCRARTAPCRVHRAARRGDSPDRSAHRIRSRHRRRRRDHRRRFEPSERRQRRSRVGDPAERRRRRARLRLRVDSRHRRAETLRRARRSARQRDCVWSRSAASVASEGTNVLHATVRDLEPHGDLVRVRTEWLSADVTPGRVADLDLAPGTRVVLSFAATDVDALPGLSDPVDSSCSVRLTTRSA